MQLKLERRRCWTADGDDENIYDDPGAGDDGYEYWKAMQDRLSLNFDLL